MSDSMPRRRGRGARQNVPNQFERLHVDVDPGALDEEERRSVETTYLRDPSASILSKNESPDVPFTYSLNPYRGCEHGCVYCLDGNTPILMGNGRTKPVRDVQVGDVIYGTERRDWYRHYVRTRVLNHWSTEKSAYRITLGDGTQIVASADHRFLTDRGWKFVTGEEQGFDRRPHLTTNNELRGVGQLDLSSSPTEEYRRGYLCGMIRGDGHLGFYSYDRPGRAHGNQWHFRLTLTDQSALKRSSSYLEQAEIQTHVFDFQDGSERSKAMRGIRTHARSSVESIQQLIEWPQSPSQDWKRGFLSGLFDAEGSYSCGVLRISNTAPQILRYLEDALYDFRFSVTNEKDEQKEPPVHYVRLLGGLTEHLRFFHLVDPAIRRKTDIEGQAIKSAVGLDVERIEPLNETKRLYDITTGTGDFIANGVVSHNCYARPSHEYWGLSAGLDFESKIFVKEEAPSLLAERLQQERWTPQGVALSGNTDPYQPVERELEITRSCLEVFLRHRNPVSIVTKSGLIRRDTDLLREMAELDLVSVAVSLTSVNDGLAGKLEPRAARPSLRLQTIEALSEAGVPVSILVAPLIPGLNDEEIPAILEAAAERGARHASYVLLRLPGPVQQIFIDWVEDHFPDRKTRILGRLRDLREGTLNDTQFGRRMRGRGEWAKTYRQLFRSARRDAGLGQSGPTLSTEHFRRLPGGQRSLFEE